MRHFAVKIYYLGSTLSTEQILSAFVGVYTSFANILRKRKKKDLEHRLAKSRTDFTTCLKFRLAYDIRKIMDVQAFCKAQTSKPSFGLSGDRRTCVIPLAFAAFPYLVLHVDTYENRYVLR